MVDDDPRPLPRSEEQAHPADRTFGEYDYDRRIEIYKVMIDSVERGIDRRYQLNRFYFSVVVAIFVSISFIVNNQNGQVPQTPLILGALILALLNCAFWFSMIIAARRLSASKYEVISELETEIEFAPFTREWIIHTSKRRDFPRFTLIELMLPATLAALCFLMVLLIVFGVIQLDAA